MSPNVAENHSLPNAATLGELLSVIWENIGNGGETRIFWGVLAAGGENARGAPQSERDARD